MRRPPPTHPAALPEAPEASLQPPRVWACASSDSRRLQAEALKAARPEATNWGSRPANWLAPHLPPLPLNFLPGHPPMLPVSLAPKRGAKKLAEVEVPRGHRQAQRLLGGLAIGRFDLGPPLSSPNPDMGHAISSLHWVPPLAWVIQPPLLYHLGSLRVSPKRGVSNVPPTQ